MHQAGVHELVVARLESGDVGEDEAAARLAQKLAGPGLRTDKAFTGRCNVFATQAGVLLLDAARVDAVNAVDEAVTVATLAPFRPIVPGDLVATVKIIPYAVEQDPLDRALAAAGEGAFEGAFEGALRIALYERRQVGIVSTLLPGLKVATVDKTLRVLADRLAPTGATILAETRVPHEAAAVGAALTGLTGQGADLVVLFGASAIADRRDVIPTGIEQAGGRVEHLGLPVDPGNLLLIGSLGDVAVIGAPGCARSPKENGFDWILHRLLAGLSVTRADIVRLGVGGLLGEIVSRPQPRSGAESADDDG